MDKQKDITSYDVIRRIKKCFEHKIKIGHAGTLDPFATGLLIVLLGKGTKLERDIHRLKKVYTVDGVFGIETDTQDITGEIVNRSEIDISKEQLENILPSFVGKILQIPPAYSAKKINGKKAYELAREGVEVKLKPKEVEVYAIELLDFQFPNFKLNIECSTGTYIRTIVHDIGKFLDTFATARSLRRDSIGNFKVSDSLIFEDITKESVESSIIGIDEYRENN